MCAICQKREAKKYMSAYDQVITLSASGLFKFIEDLMSLEPQTKKVVDKSETDDYGDYMRKTVQIPKEEIWTTLVGIQTADDGKFRVQVQNSVLDKLSTRKDRADAVKAYEAL